MGTITERTRKDGTTAFTAQIRLRIEGQPYSEAQTFHRRKLAETWLVKREAELAKGIPTPDLPIRLGTLIQRHVETFPTMRDKTAQFKIMLDDPIAELNMNTYTAADVIAYIRRRRASPARRRNNTVSASTVQHELSYLHQLLVVARTEWNYAIDPQPLDDAMAYCRNQRLAANSPKRERRLSAEEHQRLRDYFNESGVELPMNDLIDFAIYSSRRLGEICRIRWADFDPDKKVVLVRDVKHPRKKEGNDRKSRLTDEAMAIIQRQPKIDERIFPYKEASISCAFYHGCRFLGIENMHFHDLRHEAVSRLFEKGYQIHEVALFSLHQSWEHLKRYTHLKAEDIRDI